MKKTISIIISIVLIIIISGFFISYATYKKNNESNNDNSTYVDANEYISVNYKDGNYFDIDNMSSNESVVKHISITNVKDTATYVTVALMDINKQNDKIKVTLVDSDNNILYDDYLGNMDTEILKTKTLNAKESVSFDIILTNMGDYDNYGLTCNIMVYKEILESNKKIARDTILELTNVIHTEESEYLNNFTDSGLYETTDSLGTSYIYRGNVDSNYFKINDILFRIVRINGDGSIKLITQDNQLETYYRKKVSLDSYEDNVLFSKSSVIDSLSEWYNTYISSINEYVVNTSICNENTYYLENNSGKYFTSYQRLIENKTPSLKCSGTEETSKVGLVSADEVYYSGITLNNSFSYLNNGTAFFTLTGSKIIYSYNVVDLFSVSNTGLLYTDSKATTALGIRPVITLDKNIVINGNGTIDNPYKLVS